MVIHDGRLVWMIDGYTSSSKFPYSTPYSKSTNYLRNSVVVTIDAYSGELNFILKTQKTQSLTRIEMYQLIQTINRYASRTLITLTIPKRFI